MSILSMRIRPDSGFTLIYELGGLYEVMGRIHLLIESRDSANVLLPEPVVAT